MVKKYTLEERKITRIMICYKCKSRNPKLATKCRKCGYAFLRKKHKEAKK